MDTVAGLVAVGLANNGLEIALRHAVSRPDGDGLCEIVLSPRYARHLAHLLIECATDAEAHATH